MRPPTRTSRQTCRVTIGSNLPRNTFQCREPRQKNLPVSSQVKRYLMTLSGVKHATINLNFILDKARYLLDKPLNLIGLNFNLRLDYARGQPPSLEFVATIEK